VIVSAMVTTSAFRNLRLIRMVYWNSESTM
jgi:hypothetical protein